MFLIDKETSKTYHKVPFENAEKMAFLKYNSLLINDKLDAFFVKTYRYIYRIDKKVNILLKEESYPIYNKGVENTTYRISKNTLIILAYYYYKIKENVLFEKSKELLFRNYKIKYEYVDLSKFEQTKWFDEYVKSNFKKLKSNLYKKEVVEQPTKKYNRKKLF